MKNSELKNRSKYLSWSKWQKYLEGEDAFVRRYILGESYSSPEMDFGSRIAKGLELDRTDDMEVEHARLLLPNCQEREHECKTKFNGVPLYGKLDRWDGDKLLIGEVKTGKQAWTQRRADTTEQLTFYALMVFAETGKLPAITLYWFPTEEHEDAIRLKGDMLKFPTGRTKLQVLRMAGEIANDWHDIKQIYKKYKI